LRGLAVSLVVFAIAPGVVLRCLLLAWPRDDPVRAELLADLAMLPFRERPFFVASQIPNAVFDGLATRIRVARRSRAARRAARLSPGLTLLSNSDISWLAPNGDWVPALYDAEKDAITFETTPYVGMMPESNVGDRAMMLIEMRYHGPSIRPTWRIQLKSRLFRTRERQRQRELSEQMMAQYLSQLVKD
jgi:hypothetical protein